MDIRPKAGPLVNRSAALFLNHGERRRRDQVQWRPVEERPWCSAAKRIRRDRVTEVEHIVIGPVPLDLGDLWNNVGHRDAAAGQGREAGIHLR